MREAYSPDGVTDLAESGDLINALCLQAYNYFTEDDAERVKHMAEVDKLAELLSLAR